MRARKQNQESTYLADYVVHMLTLYRESPSQFASAIKGTVIILIIFMGITVLLYFLIGIAEIPVVKFSSVLATTKPPIHPEIVFDRNYSNITTLPDDSVLALIEPVYCENVTWVNYTMLNDSNSYIFDPITNETYLNPDLVYNFTNATQVCTYPYVNLPQQVRSSQVFIVLTAASSLTAPTDST